MIEQTKNIIEDQSLSKEEQKNKLILHLTDLKKARPELTFLCEDLIIVIGSGTASDLKQIINMFESRHFSGASLKLIPKTLSQKIGENVFNVLATGMGHDPGWTAERWSKNVSSSSLRI